MTKHYCNFCDNDIYNYKIILKYYTPFRYIHCCKTCLNIHYSYDIIQNKSDTFEDEYIKVEKY